MVEMIGLTTLCMLVWVLTSSLATESEAEKRRLAPAVRGRSPGCRQDTQLSQPLGVMET
jgi:hypothetical protein